MGGKKVNQPFEKITPPEEGNKIRMLSGEVKVSNNPIIPMIAGDGIGPDVTKTMKKVLDAAVKKAYRGMRRIIWFPVPAGEESLKTYGKHLPEDTLQAITRYVVAIKGPLTTPVGGGFRSLNVKLRQTLDLYTGVRPIKWIRGVPSPVKNPEKLDIVIFRENTEDVYAGIEWRQGTMDVKKMREFLLNEMGKEVREDSGIGIKPISITGTKRIVRAAISYALKNERKVVTLMHKGNIMKFTEGAFREWGYEVAKDEFSDKVVTEGEVTTKYGGRTPRDRILINDRIADSMFQQVLLRPSEYDIIATTNLNGDYISDACAAQVGGLGLAPGANINFETGVALFEPTHGTAPKYANMDKVNPSSMILSGVMMLDYMGWSEASASITKGLERTIQQKTVTYDLERQIDGATLLKCSEFGEAVVKNM